MFIIGCTSWLLFFPPMDWSLEEWQKFQKWIDYPGHPDRYRPKRSLEPQLISTVLNGIQTMAEKWEI